MRQRNETQEKKVGYMHILCWFGILIFLTSCSAIPEVFHAVETIATDGAISFVVDKEAFGKETDIHMTLDVVNKEPIVKKQ